MFANGRNFEKGSISVGFLSEILPFDPVWFLGLSEFVGMTKPVISESVRYFLVFSAPRLKA